MLAFDRGRITRNASRALPCGGALLASMLLLGACSPRAPAVAVSEAASAVGGVPREDGSIEVPAGSALRNALQVSRVAQTTVERSINVPGVIEADPARLVRIVPPTAGRIVRVSKSLGDSVRAGEPLLTLDSADLATANADAGKALAALALADRNLVRQQELVDAEIVARKDLDQAQSDQAQARSEAQRAQARLAQLGATHGAAHNGVRNGGRELSMSSPINGQVIEMSAAQGGFWNDTTAPLMTIADLSKVWLGASVQEKDLSAVFVGQVVHIVVNAYPDAPLVGRVAFIGSVLDADTRTAKVRIALDNAAGRLRPGMFAGAMLSGSAHEAITVPTSALIQDGFDTRVYVERAPWTFEPRLVKTGAQIGSQIEIVSGLQPGERVVVKDGVLLNE